MNAESELVDADQCAGEGKMAAGLVELVRHCGEFVYSARSMTDNQCRYVSNGWDGLRYGALHTKL